jgi:DNA repair photolyase
MTDQSNLKLEDYIRLANTERFVSITGSTTGRTLQVREFVYGAFVPDRNHPLSCVSVSNNSLSIDIWTGCAWQCRYCVAQGTLEDLGDNGRMSKKPMLRTKFSINEIVDALMVHPFFVKDVSVLSIGTASTEPFAPGDVTESTFEIMNAFVRRGCQNPFWIVTKGGVPKGRKQDLAAIVDSVRGVMISLCWADNPDMIEPVHNNRFLHAEEAKEAGATIAWYMRPIVSEWSGTEERIEMMMLWVKEHYRGVIDMIVPGGLRWTEGIENGLVEIYGLQIPDIPRDDNVKSLPDGLWDLIVRLAHKHFLDVPVYRHSSCALTKMLGVQNLTSVQVMARHDCEESLCPAAQRRICGKAGIHKLDISEAQGILDSLGVPARVVHLMPRLVTEPSLYTFTYAIRQTVLKHLSLGGETCTSK